MTNKQIYQNWRLETDTHQVLWAYFDKKNATVNTIDGPVMDELSNIIDDVSKVQIIYRGIDLSRLQN